ncbi:MAG: hypothetical protein ABSF22_00085 [Bryobacteraceae bacterium]|jgi:hypothetical protein
MRFLAVLFALSLRAEIPKPQALENIKQFALTHLDKEANFSCTQAAFPGTAKAITVEFSGTHRGAAPGIDAASLLQEVFAVSSGTQFAFDHWGLIGGKRVAAYRYSYLINGKTHAGLLYADANTGAISRVVFRGTAPAHLFCSAEGR